MKLTLDSIQIQQAVEEYAAKIFTTAIEVKSVSECSGERGGFGNSKVFEIIFAFKPEVISERTEP